MGWLLAIFLLAQPTWGDGKSNRTAFLRFHTAFDAGRAPAVVKIAASTAYRAKLNGRFLGAGPARAAEGYFKVDAWLLPPETANRRNELEIEVAGYQCKSYQYVIQPSFLQAEVVADGRVLAATPRDFSATAIARDDKGPVYSRQRGFPGERYRVDPAIAEPAVRLVPAVAGKLLPRTVPMPEFKVKTDFSLTTNGPGKVWSAPFNDTGFIGFKVKVTAPGVFAIRFDEALVDGRLDLFRNGNPSNSWHACLNHVWWDVKAPGDYVFETFEPYTLKYVEARMESGAGEISAPYLRQYRNPLPERARFESSDPDLDCIFRAAVDSLAENGVDLYTDCPGRERSAWLCDTWFSSAAAAVLTGDFAVERAFLENFALTTKFAKGIPEGAMSGGYPGAGLLPTYMMWYVLQCDEYLKRADNVESHWFAEFVKERIFKNLAYLSSFENADGLLENLPGWVFICWSKASEFTKGVNYPANMLWALTLETAGRRYNRTDLLLKAEKLRARIRERSFDGRYFRDQEGNVARSETCQYYAFFTGVATRETYPRLWRKLKTDFAPGKTADGLFPADLLVGSLLRLELLARDGDAARTADEIKALLLEQARTTGTFWEFVDGHDSRCHAFPSYVAKLIVSDLAGVRVEHARRTVVVRRGGRPFSRFHLVLPVKAGEVEVTADGAKVPDGWHLKYE